jgi:hypothetical protein
VAYFKSLSPTNASVDLTYMALSVGPQGVVLEFNSATITVHITAIGCDGLGGEFDRCGVCAGDGKCAPYGCDGLGNEPDECGVCNGQGTTCECALTEWRGYNTTDLDETILYSDLALLNEAMEDTENELDWVTNLLLAGEDLLSCATYGEVLHKVHVLQAKTKAYNTNVLTPFLDSLN